MFYELLIIKLHPEGMKNFIYLYNKVSWKICKSFLNYPFDIVII